MMYTRDFAASELEAASVIALWLLIHGGDPAPKTQSEIAAVAGEIIASLAGYAFGANEASVDAIRERLGALQVQVQDGGSVSPGGGVTPDYLVEGSGRVRYLIWPNPDGDPIVVPIYEHTVT
jgi:hypothetical protein